MATDDLAVFALDASRAFGEKVAHALGLRLSDHEEREFEDGEHKARPLEKVRGRDVFVVQSLHGDECQSVNDKLCRLLFFIGALKDASADRVTAVVPYLCYGRKDRKTKPRDPVTTRYVAQLLEAVGTDRVITMDAHNLAAFQNAFRCPTDHLEARRLFAEYFISRHGNAQFAVVSPDSGGAKRADALRETLARVTGEDVPLAFLEKRRSAGVVSGGAIVGDVRDRTVIIVDDIISTGTTILRAAQACRDNGATQIYAAATHGVFQGAANAVIANPAFGRVVTTNTLPPLRLARDVAAWKLEVLDASTMFAAAIDCVHAGGSISDIQEPVFGPPVAVIDAAE